MTEGVVSSDVAVVLQGDSTIGRSLAEPLTRAAILGTLVHLMHARTGVRPAIVHALTAFVNGEAPLPVLSENDTGRSLAVALQNSQALQAHEVEALNAVCLLSHFLLVIFSTSSRLRNLLSHIHNCTHSRLHVITEHGNLFPLPPQRFQIADNQGAAAAAGIAALAVAGAKNLLVHGDVSAAITAEAVGSIATDAFDSELLDLRGSNSQAATANTIRVLLEGSTRCCKLAAGATIVGSAVRTCHFARVFLA